VRYAVLGLTVAAYVITYMDRLNAKPSIRVISGRFVGIFHHEQYRLGSTRTGLSRAVRKMIDPRRTI
jgi:hypothetical protein